jgi:hypothetical protein
VLQNQAFIANSPRNFALHKKSPPAAFGGSPPLQCKGEKNPLNLFTLLVPLVKGDGREAAGGHFRTPFDDFLCKAA